MCEYDQVAERRKRGYDGTSSTVEGKAFDDLIRNPILDVGNAVDTFIGADSESGAGLLLRNLNPQNYLNNDDSSSSAPEMDTTITPTKVTNLDARQGEIDPRLKKKRKNMNSLRIREDLPTTLTSPSQSQSSGTTTIIT